ncbi:hypothetical protein J4474_03220 [Candidatus Pacearchaeota archaeon]|nr:hypothetical protein [Candidatus Pacearchaeota archaeon]
MKHKQFDYYIFIDFSENLIGYNIIHKEKMFELLPKISKFAHYKTLRNKRAYIKSIRKIIDKKKIISYFVKHKIRQMRNNLEIYMDVFDFIKKNRDCIIFVSVDNSQYITFKKNVKIFDGENIVIKKESELVKGTPEYRASLVLDTLLNVERLKRC